MKIRIFITTLLITLAGCDKQPEQISPKLSANQTVTAQFDQSYEKISKFLDQLDDPNTTQELRIQILCKDYPTEYKTNYMPALIKLKPNDYTEARLLSDLNIALDYYKKKDNVQC